MGQYGNQPDFGTRAVAITPKGFAGGSYINVPYTDETGTPQGVFITSKNLNVSTFVNGTPITKAENRSQWENNCDTDEPCWAYYGFDDANAKFGKIYNIHAVGNQDLYSFGYKLWEYDVALQMTPDFGYNSMLGKELKSIPTGFDGQDLYGTTLWAYSEDASGGVDAFGFTALPGGYMSQNDMQDSNYIARFWTDSYTNGDNVELAFDLNKISLQRNNDIYNGFYVRMTPDTNPNPTKGISFPQPLNSAALYVGTGGDLVVTVVGSETPVMFKNVPDASFLPIIVSNVWERGDDGITTASDIVAIY